MLLLFYCGIIFLNNNQVLTNQIITLINLKCAEAFFVNELLHLIMFCILLV